MNVAGGNGDHFMGPPLGGDATSPSAVLLLEFEGKDVVHIHPPDGGQFLG